MMAQYWRAKHAHPDCLIFFRMGDFFELFFEDAQIAAKQLDLTLTKRGQHQGQDIPMAGVPVHSHQTYLARLIARGHRVALCDQTEPADKNRKGLVPREVVRIVTPGTAIDEGMSEARHHTYLLAATCQRKAGKAGETDWGVAYTDVSTGDLWAESCANPAALRDILTRLQPREILLSPTILHQPDLFELLAAYKAAITKPSQDPFSPARADEQLCALYQVRDLTGFGDFTASQIEALGAVASYVTATMGSTRQLRPPKQVHPAAALRMDGATRTSLEISQTTNGTYQGSLLHHIDRCRTAMGSRCLARWLTAPSTDPVTINTRLDRVSFFIGGVSAKMHAAINKALDACPDIQRAGVRLVAGRGRTQDLGAVRDGLTCASILAKTLKDDSPVQFRAFSASLQDLHDALSKALTNPLNIEPGHQIAKGYNTPLDEQRETRGKAMDEIIKLQQTYAAQTGIPSIKIRQNNLLGYFIEVPAQHVTRLEKTALYADLQRRQSLANVSRYTSAALAGIVRRAVAASDLAIETEAALIADLISRVVALQRDLLACTQAIAVTDVAAGLAELAARQRWCRPDVTMDDDLHITGGRHPIVQAHVKTYVANDCKVDAQERLWLVTGPNMAGKSTFLRAAALIVVLAQAGAFVPAKAAKIGVVDQLFSRVGASDDLARGHSTFMTEMLETAYILHNATPRSFLILDEIGRGTSTYDGLAIAWAVCEHVHDQLRARCLFATHYREMTQLAAGLARLACYTIRVKQWGDEIVFLHEVTPGVADRSYGVQVGKLAGLPLRVVRRARAVLAHLEAGHTGDLPLFAMPPASGQDPALEEQEAKDMADLEAFAKIREQLAHWDIDQLTPRQALDALYELKGLLNSPDAAKESPVDPPDAPRG